MSGAVDASGVGLLLGLAAGGAASGLVPVINAEALLTAAAVTRPDLWFPASASITVGQCAAKVLIYLSAREGLQRLRRDGTEGRLVNRIRRVMRRPRRSETAWSGGAHPRWERLLGLLAAPLPGTAVVALSATVGLPPLALVSVLAGTARLRLPLFVLACLAGRLARFVAIAWPVAHLVTPGG